MSAKKHNCHAHFSGSSLFLDKTIPANCQLAQNEAYSFVIVAKNTNAKAAGCASHGVEAAVLVLC